MTGSARCQRGYYQSRIHHHRNCETKVCAAEFGVVPCHQVQPPIHEARPIAGQGQTKPDPPMRAAVRIAPATKRFEDHALVTAIDARSVVHDVQMKSITF